MVHPRFLLKQLKELANAIPIILGTTCIFYLLSTLESYICGPNRTTVGNSKIALVVQPTSTQIFQEYIDQLTTHAQTTHAQTTHAQNIVANIETESELRGRLNVHHWYPICGNTVDSLRRHALFPKYPNLRTSTTHLRIRIQIHAFGQRIFGYIHPPLGGIYQFFVSSSHFSEVWLSSDESPNNGKLICQVPGFTKRGKFNVYKNQRSQKISLDGGKKYFFEVLHKQGKKKGHLHMRWRRPGWKKSTDISSEFMSLFMKEELNISMYKRDYHEPLPEMILEYHMRTRYPHPLRYRNYTRLPLGSDIELLRNSRKALPTCRSFEFSKNLTRYEGQNFTQSPSVFPDDGSSLVLKECSMRKSLKYKHHCKGSPVLKKEEAYAMAEKYLNVTFPGRYFLKSIIRLEKVLVNETGHRYFIEIEVIDKESSKKGRIADHVVESHVDGKLCYPTQNTWNPDVIVYIILCVKNQGNWLRYFVNNIVEIKQQTNDENIHPIIVYFGSKDIDIDIYLKHSGLKRYTVVYKKGTFHKTAAINEAATSVKDNNSIIFQLDLHLDLPVYLFQTLRKHTIQGDLAFVPILTRLMCASSPYFPNGHWEEEGFGLFAIYKSDWIRFGGMNEKEFLNRWGGEDWEMMDRVIMAGIQVQKFKITGLFHFFHDRRQMWDKAN